MSLKAMIHVFDDSRQHGSGLLLLLAIADSCNDEDWSCYPGVPHLSRKTRMSERYVQLLARKLCEARELEVDFEDGKYFNGGWTNRYYVLDNGKRRQPTDYPKADRVNPSSPGVVNPSSPGVVNPSSPDPLVVIVSSKQEITRPSVGAASRTGIRTHASTEPSPEVVKPAKLNTQPALAQRIANYVYDIPKIAKGKLALIAEQCKRYNDDAIYSSWIDTTFLPSKVKMGDNGKKTPLMSMDDLLVMLIAEEGFQEYKRIHTSNVAPSHDNLIPDDMFAEI